MKINKNLKVATLALIFFLGLFVRVYKLDKVPPSLNWDEVAAGYNAWTIFHWGKDEWGNKYPLVFTSFRDDKHPVHVYLTAPFVGIFGLNEFTTRFPAAFISSLVILVIFFLARKMFKSDVAGLLTALFLAVSPYHIHYSRGLWEADFALFFFLLGLTLFFYGLERYRLLYFAFLSFGLSLYSYHSSKIVVPSLVLLLVILYLRKLWKSRKHFILSFVIFLAFILGLFLEPRLLGLARVKQNTFSQELLKDTWIYKKTSSEKLAGLEVALRNYPAYFSWDYLFVRGDQNPRGSVKAIGEFYKIEALLIISGLIALILLRSRITLFLLAWILLAPIPAALSTMMPNSTRALFMMGSINLLSAYGAYSALRILKFRYFQILAAVILLVVLGYEFSGFVRYYFNEYSRKEAIEWQYGMKEVVQYVERNPQYYRVYMTSVRQQPYIFFLYYLKFPLPEFLKTVKYDESLAASYNTVSSFDRYKFGGWDTVESLPNRKILYVVHMGDYIGLRLREVFDVPLLVKYPNGDEAFFAVTGR